MMTVYIQRKKCVKKWNEKVHAQNVSNWLDCRCWTEWRTASCSVMEGEVDRTNDWGR